MNIGSMFDGSSCGQVAFERAGVKVDNYFASEIDRYAIKITQKNYPDTVQLGNVLDYDRWELPDIDVLIGGSPCQDLSRIKSKDGKGLDGEKSKLFYTYYRALEKFSPKYFLLENVVMSKEDENIITSMLGVEPILIDSGQFSAQNRERLYWTNIPVDPVTEGNSTVLKDIMLCESEVDEKYYYDEDLEVVNGPEKRVYGTMNKFYANGKRRMTDTTSRVFNPDFKCSTLTAVSGGHQEKKVYVNGRIRKLTPVEYERLQTLPDGYTEGVSDSQRYKMLGNGWTVDTIAHIFKNLK